MVSAQSDFPGTGRLYNTEDMSVMACKKSFGDFYCQLVPIMFEFKNRIFQFSDYVFNIWNK